MLGARSTLTANEPGMLSALYAVFAALPRSWPLRSQKDAYVAKVRNYVEKMVSSRVTVEELAEYCGLDRHYLCRVFKAETGLTLQEYVIGCKMRRARELLAVSTLSVGDVARSVGYDDSFNFSKNVQKTIRNAARARRAKRDKKAPRTAKAARRFLVITIFGPDV
jgi:transcriptional regulator GlxA family with amidase domain